MRRICTIGVLLALLCFLLSWAGYRLLDRVPTFWVSRITIAGTQRCDQKRIKELTDPAYGRCIFKVNLSDLHQKIQSISWIKSLSIHRVMPSTLEIQVQERVPVAIVQADRLYLVDSDGVLIDEVPKKPSADIKPSEDMKSSADMKPSAAMKSSEDMKSSAAMKPSATIDSSSAVEGTWGHLPLITGLNLSSMVTHGGTHSVASIDGGTRPVASINGEAPLNYGMGSKPCLAAGCKVESPCLKSALDAVALMQGMKATWLAEISEINVKDPENITLCSKAIKRTARKESAGCRVRGAEQQDALHTTHDRALQPSLTAPRTGCRCNEPAILTQSFEIRLGTNDNLREKLMYLQTTWSSIKALRWLNYSGSGFQPLEYNHDTGSKPCPAPTEMVSGIEYIDLRYKNQLIVKPYLKKVISKESYQLSVISYQ
jgi:hypothetical protein